MNYKYLAMFAAGWGVILITLMILMPESPRYLLRRRQRDKALDVLRWLRGPYYDVEGECSEINESLNSQVC